MTIASQIQALQTDKTNIANAIVAKGGTVQSDDGFDDFATDIGTIQAQKEEQSKNISLGASTPSTVTPDSGKALSSVVPVIDTSIIKAENIAKDVVMLGITGTHEGGGGGSKYGATMDSFFNDLTSSGVYDPPSSANSEEMVFTGLRTLASSNNYPYIFAYKFMHCPAKKIKFPDLTAINCQNAFYYGFQYAKTEEIDFPSLTTVALSQTFYYGFYYCKAKKISFGALTTASKTYMFYHAFDYAGISQSNPLTVEFPELTTISGPTAFSNAFAHAYLGYGILHPFPKLTTIGAASTLTTVFSYTNCIRYIFDKLTAVSYTNTFTTAWQYCNPGGSAYDETHGIMFPALTTIGVSGSTSVYRCFPSCCLSSNNKMNGYFSSLTAIYNNYTTASNAHFATCGMVKIFMPKLTALGNKPEYTFYNSTTITEMHFGIENQSTIEAITGYSSKFGATNATIYFDLANHITIDGVVYDRDGSTDDYDNWYIGFTNGDTTYYIDNFYGAVGDVAYVKSGDTYTASGYTVSAVA